MTHGAFEPYPTIAPPSFPPEGWEPSGPAPDEAPAPARRNRLVVEVVVLGAAFYLPGLIQGLHGISDPSSISTDVGFIDTLATVFGQLGPALVALFLLWRDGALRLAGFERRSTGFVLGYGALGYVCAFVAVLTFGIIVLGFHAANGNDTDAEDTTTAGQEADVPLSFGSLATAAAISIAAGIAEETVFRAYATTRLEQAGLARTAVWAPWLVFTALHLYEGPIPMLGVGMLAAVFTWLYRWKRSVYPVMLTHAAYDFSILLLVATTTTGILR